MSEALKSGLIFHSTLALLPDLIKLLYSFTFAAYESYNAVDRAHSQRENCKKKTAKKSKQPEGPGYIGPYLILYKLGTI